MAPVRHRCCKECSKPLATTAKATAEFCGTPCRIAWRNRRTHRGAELYDIFMAIRFDRPLAASLGLWALACRMASVWNEDDKEAGRQSYVPPREAVMRLNRYNAVATKVKR